ncbi:MAG: site-specific DNA-methyltransferase [Rhodobacteraceae bacterium]|nr:site-specific DNA-methyltransferase [Paracoccaceae bacterium]
MTGIERDITIGTCRLILGDMRDVLPALRPAARLCLTDPPYRLTAGGSSTGEMGGCFAKSAYDNSGALFDMVAWEEMAPLIGGALADDADAIVMVSDREEASARAAFASAGFGFHRLLVWDKITATPNRWYMPNCEFGLYLYKGRASRIRDCASKALIRCPQQDVSHLYLGADVPPQERRPHATEKPVALMSYWMGNSTDRGDLVIDPFMGSGSVLVAAMRSGRAAIGIEKDPKWFDVACARVADAARSAQAELPVNARVSARQEAMVL